MTLIIVACCTIALAGGFIVGVVLGTLAERERSARRRPPAPHEALALVYQMPAPAEILAELRGPLGKGPA